MDNIKKILKLIGRKQRWMLALLIVMLLIGTALELLGVSAILPFVETVTNPNLVEAEGIVGWLYTLFGKPSYSTFLIFMLMGLVVVYVLKNAFLLLLYNFQYKFSFENQRALEGELLQSYLEQDYTFHLKYNSAELQRNILNDVMGLYHTITSYLQLMTEGSVCLALFIYLLYLDKTITLGIVGVLAITFGLYNLFFGKRNNRIGIDSRKASAMRVQWVMQSLGGIKEIKILGREHFFLNNYDKNAEIYATKQRQYMMATTAPRPIMEATGITALLAVIGIKLSMGVNAAYFLPTLSTFAVAAFRILPSFGRLSGAIGAIAFQRSAVTEVYNGIMDARKVSERRRRIQKTDERLVMNSGIYCNGITFGYPDSDKLVLENVDVTIPKNSSVAFIGPSGAGKSTLVDVILGILKPQDGSICVDNAKIEEHLDEWHNMIGYIPQTIYLIDDSIRRNIAFGIDEEDIDDERIWQVLKEVQLYDFVKNLEGELDSYIGEGGVRISGGQRQRIGIARALYTNPDVLVLDEATSALDSETEAAIMDAINRLRGSRTMIIIAHRLTTVKNCDTIYQVKDKKVTVTTI